MGGSKRCSLCFIYIMNHNAMRMHVCLPVWHFLAAIIVASKIALTIEESNWKRKLKSACIVDDHASLTKNGNSFDMFHKKKFQVNNDKNVRNASIACLSPQAHAHLNSPLFEICHHLLYYILFNLI
jgi:hypothetical protein